MPIKFNIPAYPEPFDLSKVKVHPLEARASLTSVDKILVPPDSVPPSCSEQNQQRIEACADRIIEARRKGASVVLIYGAHLLRNGASLVLERMMGQGWITHLATNGAGTIHDWEYAYLGRSTENVGENVATGTFGTWDETSRHIHQALLAGNLRGEGYGRALGRFIMEDGAALPTRKELKTLVKSEPDSPLNAARMELLLAQAAGHASEGPVAVPHNWKYASILGQAFRHQIPLTVHPGIGYDIISNHPGFNGGVIGRAATVDFRLFASALEHLDGGVVLSVGSAIMGPQVFEKALSCVNNVRLQQGRPIVSGHSIYVVDLQDGGGWDWNTGEPPKTNPAYYLRFCKSFSRMGGAMSYLQCDNLVFAQRLYHELCQA